MISKTKTKLCIALFLFLTFYFIFQSQKEISITQTNNLSCSHKIVGNSMEPTFFDGNKVCINTNLSSPLTHHEVIVYKLKTSPNFFIKRIIALPGDKITFGKDNKIYINEEYLEQPYLKNKKEFEKTHLKLLLTQLENFNFIIPQNMILVFGDNRANSIDSSNFGLLPKDYILGTVVKN